MAHYAGMLLVCVLSAGALASTEEVRPLPEAPKAHAEREEAPHQIERKANHEDQSTENTVLPSRPLGSGGGSESAAEEHSGQRYCEYEPEIWSLEWLKKCTDQVQAVTSVAMTFLTIIGVLLLFGTLRETRKTLRIAEDTQGLTEKALKETQTGLALNQEIAARSATATIAEFQPYFEFRNIRPVCPGGKGPLAVTMFFSLCNVGKSAAHDLEFEVEGTTLEFGTSTFDGGDQFEAEIKIDEIRYSGETVQPQQSLVVQFKIIAEPPEAYRSRAYNEDGNFTTGQFSRCALSGYMTYANVFGERKRCQFFVSNQLQTRNVVEVDASLIEFSGVIRQEDADQKHD